MVALELLRVWISSAVGSLLPGCLLQATTGVQPFSVFVSLGNFILLRTRRLSSGDTASPGHHGINHDEIFPPNVKEFHTGVLTASLIRRTSQYLIAICLTYYQIMGLPLYVEEASTNDADQPHRSPRYEEPTVPSASFSPSSQTAPTEDRQNPQISHPQREAGHLLPKPVIVNINMP